MYIAHVFVIVLRKNSHIQHATLNPYSYLLCKLYTKGKVSEHSDSESSLKVCIL